MLSKEQNHFIARAERDWIRRCLSLLLDRKFLGILFALVRDHREYTKDYSNTAHMKTAA